MKKRFINGQKLAILFLFGTFSLAQAQTNLQVIERQNGNVEQEERSFTDNEKQILERLLKSMGVEETIDQVLETKNIKIILEDKMSSAPQIMAGQMPTIRRIQIQNGGFLGVYYELKEGQGAEVTEVITGTSADEMGLKTGDIIRSINGREVAENFSQTISTMKPNDAIKLDIKRGDTDIVLNGKLGERSGQPTMHLPKEVNIEKMQKIEMAPISKPMLGVMLQTTGNQVRIDGLIENSPATTMALESGDVLKKINSKKIGSIEDVKSAVSSIAVGEEIKVLIERDGKKVRKSAKMTEVSYIPKQGFSKHMKRNREMLQFDEGQLEENIEKLRFLDKDFEFRGMPLHVRELGNSRVFIISNTPKESKQVIIEEEVEISGDNSSIQLYPNPSQGILNISFQSQENAKADVKVFDANNKLIFEKSYQGTGAVIQESINIEEQPAGVYIIQIEMNGEVEAEKIILEK